MVEEDQGQKQYLWEDYSTRWGRSSGQSGLSLGEGAPSATQLLGGRKTL